MLWSVQNFKLIFAEETITFFDMLSPQFLQNTVFTPLTVLSKHNTIFKQPFLAECIEENKFLWMKNSVKSLILLSVENSVQKNHDEILQKKK